MGLLRIGGGERWIPSTTWLSTAIVLKKKTFITYLCCMLVQKMGKESSKTDILHILHFRYITWPGFPGMVPSSTIRPLHEVISLMYAVATSIAASTIDKFSGVEGYYIIMQ
jgi:hypothetical protein